MTAIQNAIADLKAESEQIDHMLGSRLSVYNRKHGRGIKHNTGHS